MACKSIITHIEAQAERIISQYETLEAQATQLREERDALLVELRKEQEQLREAKAEIQRLRLAVSLGGKSKDNDKSRARINLLLREVDKCIALLNKAQEN